ncbi:MAG: hypothetical protein ACLFVW_07495 [Phycisphaerae bacterium]
MAFAFFRRRQKLVIIIMAVLMVAFLVGFQGLQQLVSGNRGERTLGTSRWGELVNRDLERANSDINLLGAMGLGSQQRFMGAIPTGTQFAALMQNDQMDAALAYALLLQEARNEGLVSVSEDDVDRFFEALGLTGAQYERFATQISERPGRGEEILRSTAARWLTIMASFGNASSRIMPSEPELLHTFRDLNEEIDLLVGEFRAVDLLEEVTEQFTDEDILEHYNRYRTRSRDTFESAEDFGFGYRRPDRVGISYLFVDREVVERVARPSRAEILDYWQRNREQFVREVPVNGDSDEGEEYRTEPMDFASAEPLIVEELSPEVADGKVEALLARADQVLQDIPSDSETDPYVQVRRRMMRSARNTLQRQVTVRIVREPLRDAIEKLADAAGLDAICYPWGDMGDVSIDPSVEITLPTERTSNATLGELLDLVGEQLLGDGGDAQIDWVHCAKLGNALFPVDGELEMFPLVAERTELLSIDDLPRRPILGNAYTSRQGGEGLWNRAFDLDVFRGERDGSMSEGDTGARMFVRDPHQGRLLWRVTEAAPARDAPEAGTVDEIPSDLLDEVRRDMRLVAAMEIARERADDAIAQSDESDIREVLEQSGARVFETGLFSRKTYGLQWRGIPQMRAGGQEVLRHMARGAFELAGEDDAESDEPAETKLLDLPPRRSVAVLHRLDYSPAVKAEYEQMRNQLVTLLVRNRFVAMCFEWFDSDNVIRRSEFKSTGEAGCIPFE